MRAVYLAALIVFCAAALTLNNQAQAHLASRGALLLAQNVSGPQSAPAAPQTPSKKSQGQENSNSSKLQRPEGNTNPADPPSDPNAQQPSTTPWLGAPPQFQRTWPPTPLPQSDDDDLLLIQTPRHPPKVHKA